MSNKDNLNGIGHVNRCGGIPKYPNEYVFDMEPPEGYTKQHDEARRKKLSKFLAQYGLELVE